MSLPLEEDEREIALAQAFPAAQAPEPAPEPSWVSESGVSATRAQRSAASVRKIRPRSDRLRIRILQLCGIVVIGFLIFEFVASGLLQHRAQREALSDFKNQANALSVVPESIPAGTAVGVVSIPGIDRQLVIVEGTTAELLQEGPGHLRSTPLPGQPGNAVVMGKRTTFGAPFRGIGNLLLGAPIAVTTTQGTFTYRATSSSFVPSGQADAAFATTAENRLTLVTSDPAYMGSQRLVVQAVLDGQAVAPANVRPLAVDSSELGLATDFSAVPGFALAVLMVIGSFLFLPRAYRAFPLRVAYLITTPIVLASLVLLYRSLDRLLPAML